ncbi:hypothetical protein LCGC14_3135540 [marine sediment metagenome]|uniref:Uncharacterized protein n=1 Tax=marine sediment metagenome TaxID=412755 RepID=A0A0F8WMD6_9ZZZZ
MKGLVLGALAGAGLVMAAIEAKDHGSKVFAQQLPLQSRIAAGELIALPGAIGQTGQLLTVIDPKQRVMSVYHIDSATGKIGLRSVRNIHWDLQMTYFDNEGLLPQEIRALLEQSNTRNQ